MTTSASAAMATILQDRALAVVRAPEESQIPWRSRMPSRTPAFALSS